MLCKKNKIKNEQEKKHSIVMCLMMLMQKSTAYNFSYLLFLFETLPSFTNHRKHKEFAFCKHLSK